MEKNQSISKRGGARPGSGRPKGVPNKATRDLKELAQVYTAAALKTLSDIMRRGESEAARVAAARELLDRGYGRATQTIDAKVETTKYVVEMPMRAREPGEWLQNHGPH